MIAASVLDPAGATAQAVGRKQPPQPPAAETIHPGVLNVAVRTALASGAEYLLRNADTNYLHYVAPPRSTRVQTGWEKTWQVPVHYKYVEYDQPIYEHKYEYEEYEVFVVGAAGSTTARQVQKVKRRRQRVVGTKQVGTRKAKRLVHDPNGPIVQQHTRHSGPIYGPGAEWWPDHLPGDNSLALLALLKSGVPQSDERLVKLADALNDYVSYYGVSDLTWNIGWMAAAFANLHEKRYVESRDLLISRILDGQIATGPARGMWGPICINMEILPVLLEHERRMGESLAEMKKTLPRKLAQTKSASKQDRLRQEVEQAESGVQAIAKLYKPVTQQGLRFESLMNTFRLRQNHWEEDVRHTAGLPYYIYNQQLADLESTALAMYAIREAAANDCLPSVTQVPDLSGGRQMNVRRSPLQPQKSSRMLARAAAALAALQQRDGSFDQCNIHQPLTAFQSFGLEPLPKKEHPKSLPSVRTAATTALGYSALSSAGQAVGMRKLFRKYGRTIRGARGVMTKDAESYLDRREEPVLPEGRVLAPFDLYFAMCGVHRSAYAIVEDRRDLWMRFAYEILVFQHDSGKWPEMPTESWPPKERRLHASSLWAWKPFSLNAKHEIQQERVDADKRKPFNIKSHWNGAWYGYMSNRQNQYLERFNREVVSTSLAMLFLADGVYPPIGGYIDLTGRTPPPRVLDMVCGYLRGKQNISATCLQLTPDNISSTVKSLPMIFMSGSSATTNALVASALKQYLQKDGVVVVEVRTLAERTTAELKLRSLLPGSTIKPLSAQAEFLKDYRGSRPSLKALYHSDGKLAGLFLAEPGTGNPGRAAQYAQVAYLLARNRIGPQYFDPQYPSLYIGDDPFVARIEAMTRLLASGQMPDRAKMNTSTPKVAPLREDKQGAGDDEPVEEEIIPDDEQF